LHWAYQYINWQESLNDYFGSHHIFCSDADHICDNIVASSQGRLMLSKIFWISLETLAVIVVCYVVFLTMQYLSKD